MPFSKEHADGIDSVSVCLPARNEAATIGAIVRAACEVDFVDEVVVIDDGSVDDTARVAADAGATVFAEAEILPEAGPGSGKGNVLWKSLYACRGDLVVWLDADLQNFDGAFIDQLCEGFEVHPALAMMKATYKRALNGAPTGGGRVNELVARPLLSLLFPELVRFAQPLAGEYAVRRTAVDSLPFVQGWGVEMGLLIDLGRDGGGAVQEVDLGVREHRNRPLEELAPQAQEIMATVLQRAGLMPDETISQRPPMTSLTAYREKFAPLR